jgi:hypothetical protein
MPASPQSTATPRCHCQAIIVAARKPPNTNGKTLICVRRSAAACSRFHPQTRQYAFSPAGLAGPPHLGQSATLTSRVISRQA